MHRRATHLVYSSSASASACPVRLALLAGGMAASVALPDELAPAPPDVLGEDDRRDTFFFGSMPSLAGATIGVITSPKALLQGPPLTRVDLAASWARARRCTSSTDIQRSRASAAHGQRRGRLGRRGNAKRRGRARRRMIDVDARRDRVVVVPVARLPALGVDVGAHARGRPVRCATPSRGTARARRAASIPASSIRIPTRTLRRMPALLVPLTLTLALCSSRQPRGRLAHGILRARKQPAERARHAALWLD